MSYNLQFESLCKALGLGRLLDPPAPLTGGHLHRMYGIRADKGRYAVKALNPQVMARPAALPGIIEAEHIAVMAAWHIPAAPALLFNGSAVQVLDGQYYLLYDWIDGTTLQNEAINSDHCAVMGTVLAALHQIDFGALSTIENSGADEPAVDWAYYLRLGFLFGSPWAELLGASIEKLNTWSAQLAKAAQRLSPETVVSHRDLEPKNVLWRNDAPVIIDWEAAGRIHPALDLVETAVYWSKDAQGEIEENKFKSFVSAYKNVKGPINADWNTILAKGFSTMSGWLEYSLKRSLLLDCSDAEEQQLGCEHVFGTIAAVQRYFETVPMVCQWLTELI